MTRADAPVGNSVARDIFAGLPRRYDRLAYLLSFGQDRRWRRAVVNRVAAAQPAQLLDVATGPAGVAIAAERETHAFVIGVDLNEPMLVEGARNVGRAGAANRVALVVARAERLPLRNECVDAVTFSYLLRYVEDPAATVAELARCVKPGGTLASLEFAVPPGGWWRAFWSVYTVLVLPVLGWLTGGPAWWRVGRFLGPSIRAFYARWPVEAQVAAWTQAGLRDVGWRRMSLGGGLVMWGTKS
jgi:demethylmenaquinone methyltransferase/2-methoxy-6-polyprenyl-1,4-benzoquinol methylase